MKPKGSGATTSGTTTVGFMAFNESCRYLLKDMSELERDKLINKYLDKRVPEILDDLREKRQVTVTFRIADSKTRDLLEYKSNELNEGIEFHGTDLVSILIDSSGEIASVIYNETTPRDCWVTFTATSSSFDASLEKSFPNDDARKYMETLEYLVDKKLSAG